MVDLIERSRFGDEARAKTTEVDIPIDAVTLVTDDPTWAAEYAHFRLLCAGGNATDLSNDLWLNRTLRQLAQDALAETDR